jgi:hypothetical protein
MADTAAAPTHVPLVRTLGGADLVEGLNAQPLGGREIRMMARVDVPAADRALHLHAEGPTGPIGSCVLTLAPTILRSPLANLEVHFK